MRDTSRVRKNHASGAELQRPPYYGKTDLVHKHILSNAAYDRIKSLITIE
jgi:hypothetical protein